MEHRVKSKSHSLIGDVGEGSRMKERRISAQFVFDPVNAEEAEDENKERGNWSNDLQFVLACMGYAIGLGNVWRFPYLMYQYGGGFLVAYWILLFLVAFPIFAFELVVGQFASRGPVHLFRAMIPAFEGLGWTTLYVQCLNSIYYNSIHAYAIFYLFSSFGSPWKRCEDPAVINGTWNSPTCFTIDDYRGCIKGKPSYNYYAKKRCYAGDDVATDFLRRLEDDCLLFNDSSRYKRPVGLDDWECGVKLRFFFNKTKPNHIFGLEPTGHFATQHMDKTNKEDCNYCGKSLFFQWDGCTNEDIPIAIDSPKDWNNFTREGTDPMHSVVKIDLNSKGKNAEIHLTAQCFASILLESSHPRYLYTRDPRFYADPRRHRSHFLESQAEEAEAEVEAAVVPKLAAVFGLYCNATFPDELDRMNTAHGLPSAACVARVVDPVESFSSEEYFNFYGQRGQDGHNGQDLRDAPTAGMSYPLLLSLLLAWLLIVVGLYKGPKWTGKLVYVTAGFPFIMIMILIVVSVFLKGSFEGVKYYISFEACRLANFEMWKDALAQIFFSLSIGGGGLMTLSSYNRFHNDIVKDSLMVAMANCIFSFIGGFGIFGIIGYMAHMVSTEVPMVLRGSSSGVGFVVFAQATTGMKGGEIFAAFFYLMLVLLAIDSQFAGVEMILTFIYDEFPTAKRYRFFTTTLVACIGCCIGLPYSSNVGFVSGDHLDTSLYSVCIPMVAFGSLMMMCVFYGPRRFLEDLRLMIGASRADHGSCVGNFFVNTSAQWYLIITWCTFAPIGVGAMLVVHFMKVYNGWGHNAVNDISFFALGLGPTLLLLLGAPLYNLIVRGYGCCEIFRPTPAWGPALPDHRTGRYATEEGPNDEGPLSPEEPIQS